MRVSKIDILGEIKDRDHARRLIELYGITVKNVTEIEIISLWHCLKKSLQAFEGYRGTMDTDSRPGFFMTCKCDDWAGREAFSFNRDGFIGIAGWADRKNVKPFLSAIREWLLLRASLN